MPSKPKVLVVDDELGVRESLRAILSQDCDVLTAASGAEALKIVGGEQIALVTLDLRMPGMAGDSEVSSSPSAQSRGQKPVAHRAQWE